MAQDYCFLLLLFLSLSARAVVACYWPFLAPLLPTFGDILLDLIIKE